MEDVLDSTAIDGHFQHNVVPMLPPIGVFRAVERPEYGEELSRQIVRAQEQRGAGDLGALLRSGSSWTVS